MDGSNISRKAPSQLICYSKISNVWYFIQCITQCCKHTLKLDNEIYAGRKTMRKGWRGVKTQTALHFPFLLKKIGKKKGHCCLEPQSLVSLERQWSQVLLIVVVSRKTPFSFFLLSPPLPVKPRYETKSSNLRVPCWNSRVQQGLQNPSAKKNPLALTCAANLNKEFQMLLFFSFKILLTLLVTFRRTAVL